MSQTLNIALNMHCDKLQCINTCNHFGVLHTITDREPNDGKDWPLHTIRSFEQQIHKHNLIPFWWWKRSTCSISQFCLLFAVWYYLHRHVYFTGYLSLCVKLSWCSCILFWTCLGLLQMNSTSLVDLIKLFYVIIKKKTPICIVIP